MQRYFELGLSSATRRTYQSGISKFNQFCSAYNVTNPLPVSQTTLCSFVSYLANRGLAHANPTVVRNNLRSSKTGKGVEVFLGKTDDEELCPVAALLAYLAVRGGAEGPLFRLQDGRYMTSDVFIARVRATLINLGYDANAYAGHSFRIGAATTAAERGIEDSVIKMMGRRNSSAYQLYIRSAQHMLASVAGQLTLRK